MQASMPDLTDFFVRYEKIVAQADALFSHIQANFPEEVACKGGCSSCCHAMFDLSLIEILYLNRKFAERYPQGMERFTITERADSADRRAAKLKRALYKESRSGKDSNAILDEAAKASIRCPLLDGNDLCVLYDVRPITCRVYGVPTSIGGRAHTCGKTGFCAGKSYPTVNMDKMQEMLLKLNVELAAYLGSSYKELYTMYVPVSTAIITTFDAAYLGIGGIAKEE